MIYDLLIRTFKDGDWFIGCVMWVLAGLFALFLSAGLTLCYEEIQWLNTKEFPWPAELVSANFTGSTLRTSAVPVVTGKGVGMGAVTTGNPEQYITLWDCGEYGRLVVDDKNLFRIARPKMTLYLKKRGDEVRVSGWES